MILKTFIGLCTALVVFGIPGAFPQEAPPAVPAKDAKTADKPVMLGDQVLFHLATEAEGITQAKRSIEVSNRIKKIADSTRVSVDSITTSDFNTPMTFIVAGDEIVMSIIDQDVVSKGKSRQQLAAEYAQILRSAIEKYRRDRSLKQHIYSALYTLIATIIFVAILILLGKLKHKIDRRIDERFSAWKKGLQIQSFEIVRAEKISEVLKGGVKGIRLILVLIFFIYLFAACAGIFPLDPSHCRTYFGLRTFPPDNHRERIHQPDSQPGVYHHPGTAFKIYFKIDENLLSGSRK